MLVFLSYRKNFLGSQKRVRISHGKRAIGVRAIEVRLYAIHAPHHGAVSPFGPWNNLVISSAPAAETDFAGLGISRHTGFRLEFLSLDGLPAKVKGSIHSFQLRFELLGELAFKAVESPPQTRFV